MASIAQTLTVWIVLLVAVDRYFAVCKPWLAADVITRRRHVRAAVCAVVIAAIIYNIPRFFERQVRHIIHNADK
jgi:hypothetical protein